MTTLPSGITIEKNVLLKPFTSWLVGGPADFFAQPKTIDELKDVYTWGLEQKLPISILGGGTNVLISDRGVRGLVIALRKFAGATTSEQNGRFVIECLSGTSKSELLKIFLKAKLEPALFLAGLPGDVGGGVVMNAGVGEMMKPREFTEIVDWVEVLRVSSESASNILFETIRYAHDDLTWSYRHCEGWRPGVITKVGLSWPSEPSADVLNKVRSANQVRLSKQPLDMPSCGSVFVNPPGTSSGRVIEASGLKGFSIGGAMVSPKHANFIVNTGSATASDIRAVIEHVQKVVLEKQSISLKTEVVAIGD